MKKHLFYTFLLIFAATAGVTLMGVTGAIAIKDGYLTPLVGAFLIELGGAVIAIFKGANFFEPISMESVANDDMRGSIRKLDSAFGYVHDRLNSCIVEFETEILTSKYLEKTPRTDIMVAAGLVETYIDKVDDKIIGHLLNTIGDILEKGFVLGSVEKGTLLNLAAKLPDKHVGTKERLMLQLKNK